MGRMMNGTRRLGLAAALLGLWATTAHAQGDGAPTLPSLALQPVPDPSMWHGLSVGTELIAVSGKGGGGFGGDVFAGYDKVFDNNIVLGVRGSTGYMPGWGNRKLVRGYEFGAADVEIGYEMGRLTPYVTAGVALARPHFGAGASAPGSDSVNLLLNGGGETQVLTRVGAGVNYAVTNNLTVGVAVSTIQGRGPLYP